jgi:hypothetical protein
MLGNIVRCPDCKATLIDEDRETHKCQTHGLQWFIDGDWLWGNQGDGWMAFNLKSPDMIHPNDITRRRYRVDIHDEGLIMRRSAKRAE